MGVAIFVCRVNLTELGGVRIWRYNNQNEACLGEMLQEPWEISHFATCAGGV